jgi:excisionase family DNA binding protein
LSADNAQPQLRPPDQLAQHDSFSRTSAPIEPWIGVDDLALVLGVSIDWIYEKAACGELPSYKFGGHRRFRVSEVEDWASRCASGNGSRWHRPEEALSRGIRSPASD